MAKTLFQINQLQDESPLGPYASWPLADAKLNFYDSTLTVGNFSKKIVSPVKKQIFGSITGAFINFQTQAVSNASDFDIAWPVSNTVGQFRRVGFTLIGTGKIKVLFSNEFATEGALPDGGTLLVTGGQPLGYIDLECTNVAGYFKTAGSVTSVIEPSKIYRFSAGGGGGSGTGDANSFTENLKHRLVSSYYEFVTPVVFELEEATKTSSATATYDVVDGVYSFSSAGQNVVSINMFDQEFLNNEDDSRQIELHAEWFDSASLDLSAVYEVSLDGSAFETVTMERQGESNKFTGSKLLAIPSNATISSNAGGVTNTELNATTLQAISAPITLASKAAVRQLAIELDEIGTPVGSYIIKICEDNAGVPGDILYSQIALVSTLSAGLNVITLSNFRNVLGIGTYHVVIETDATYKAGFSAGVNSIRVRTSASGGNDLVFNGTSWSAGTVDIKYTLSGHAYDLRVKITSSASGKKLKAFGIFYDEQVGSVSDGDLAIQKFIFNGSSNVTTFNITQFLPNPDHLKVYDVKTGQVYVYPAFNIDGHSITFPSGTFLVPSETVELRFDQSQGSGYDHSDYNNNLLASNHLGSSDMAVDKSSSGRGILLRNSNGELKELWLDASNNLNITDPL